MDNLYIYNPETGYIQYSIDSVSPQQVDNFKKKGIPFVLARRASIMNQYVVVANGQPIGFDAIKDQEVVADKSSIFADGEDTIVFTGLADGTKVSINEQYVWTSNSTDTSFTFSVNGYSSENPVVKFETYGYRKAQFNLNTLMPPTLTLSITGD
jgi:hypothetical protein